VLKAFAVLSTEKGAELERDPTDLINGMNRGDERSQVVPSKYLEIVVNRR